MDNIQLACLSSQSRYQHRDDILVLLAPEHSQWAGLFTQNSFAAAPVQIARQRLAAHSQGQSLRALLINAGHANAATGARGHADALQLCASLAQQLDLRAEQVIPCSTGVIGEYLPMRQLQDCLQDLPAKLGSGTWQQAAKAIWTTDTQIKLVRQNFTFAGAQRQLVGIAKGSGMIHPDMATMIALLATDAGIRQADLHKALRLSAAASFNAISVDSDTSTNDSLLLVASGAVADYGDSDLDNFQQALLACCQQLSQQIVADGEGAQRVMQVQVKGGRDVAEARRVALSVANSPLVKTALHAADPNWGRIISAVGQAKVEALDPDGVKLFFGSELVFASGCVAGSYTEAAGAQQMRQPQVLITIELGRGAASFCALGCDLSAEYVRINSEYRS